MADSSSKLLVSKLPQPRGVTRFQAGRQGPSSSLASTRVTRQSLSAPDLRKVGVAAKTTAVAQRATVSINQHQKVAAANVLKTSQQVASRKRPAAATSTTALHGGKRPLVQTEANKQAAKPAAKVPPSDPASSKRKPAPWDVKAKLGNANDKIARLAQENENLKNASVKAEQLSRELATCMSNYERSEKELRQAKEKIKENEGLITTNQNLREQVHKLTEKVEEITSKLSSCTKEIEDFKIKIHLLNEEITEERANVSRLSEELLSAKKQEKSQLQQIDQLHQLRREMHNQILDLKGNVRVFCRVRPPLSTEKNKLLCSFTFPDERSLDIKGGQDATHNTQKYKTEKASFTYDKVFTPLCSQDDIYEELSQLVQSAIDGYNVCIFAYGQTGSGKTYTMEGGSDPSTQGMIPRAIKSIFSAINDQSKLGWEFTIKCSFLEIYNENIRDLLNPNSNLSYDIKMVETNSEDVCVSNLKIEVVRNEDDFYRLLAKAQKHRSTAATYMNNYSSRSHSISQIKIEGFNKSKKTMCQGTLNLIDLAGSEKYRSENESNRQVETCNINKSLTSLSLVVLKLAEKADHVPFRDSKLTHLLMPSLKGNSKTLMLVNIAPSEDCFQESLSSLRFASRVSHVKVNSKKQIKSSLGSISSLKINKLG